MRSISSLWRQNFVQGVTTMVMQVQHQLADAPEMRSHFPKETIFCAAYPTTTVSGDCFERRSISGIQL